MDELEQILLDKLRIYKMLYITSDVMGSKKETKYYGKCIKKLNKMIKIL
tara:strand:+ start:5692 stop:5838 length:147 start_codon:yes stop_codon:yes gene_type:complete